MDRFTRIMRYQSSKILAAVDKEIKLLESDTGGSIISYFLPVAVAMGIVISLFRRFTINKTHKIWVVSPSGKTTICLPFYLALRVICKRGWTFAKVEPIRVISRGEALRILLVGDKKQQLKLSKEV